MHSQNGSFINEFQKLDDDSELESCKEAEQIISFFIPFHIVGSIITAFTSSLIHNQGHLELACEFCNALPGTEFRSNKNNAGVWLRRIQFPFRLSFAMTINKSQGQTFKNVGLLLRHPSCSHGQLNVAASRVRNFHSLCILVDTYLMSSNRQGLLRLTSNDNGVNTKNVMFHEVLNYIYFYFQIIYIYHYFTFK